MFSPVSVWRAAWEWVRAGWKARCEMRDECVRARVPALLTPHPMTATNGLSTVLDSLHRCRNVPKRALSASVVSHRVGMVVASVSVSVAGGAEGGRQMLAGEQVMVDVWMVESWVLAWWRSCTEASAATLSLS